MAEKHVYDMNRVPLREVVPLDTPFQVSIEPTFNCNLKCNYCLHARSRASLINQGFKFGQMPIERFKLITQQLKAFPAKIKKVTLAGLGEPLLHNMLPKMVEILKQSNVCYKVLVISNGVLLNHQRSQDLLNAGLDELKISLQGVDSEKYEEISRAKINFDELTDNIAFFNSVKGTALLKIKIADTSLDCGESNLFYDRFSNLCDYIDIEHIIPQFSGVDYKDILSDSDNNRFGFPLKQLNVCSILFFRINVLNDGRITLGQCDGVTFDDWFVEKTSLIDAWNSNERIALLRDQLTGIRDNCKGCMRWSESAVPDDVLDGYEDKILTRFTDMYSIVSRKDGEFLCKRQAKLS